MERRKRILVTPLDWGLGHATRCVPIINGLVQRGCKVIIAGSGASLALLKQEFPALKFYDFPGYAPVYPQGSNMVAKMAFQLPHFISVINREHAATLQVVRSEKIDGVISDNRYGCYSRRVPSVFITHQVNILMPAAFKWMETWVNYFNHRQINHFKECWVPAAENNFLPELTKSTANIKMRYIGFLSRMKAGRVPQKYAITAVASGPQPQRGIFNDIIKPQLEKAGVPAIMVKGSRGEEESEGKGGLQQLSYCNSGQLNQLLNASSLVIARPGYSTVMDLMKLGKKAIFIPTPGQTEQEYLAEELMRRKIAYSMPQQGFNLNKALQQAEKYSGFGGMYWEDDLLNKALDSIV